MRFDTTLIEEVGRRETGENQTGGGDLTPLLLSSMREGTERRGRTQEETEEMSKQKETKWIKRQCKGGVMGE